MMDENLKTYLKWKEECARKGKTPADMVMFSRSIGMPESYITELQFIIEDMETKLAELVPAFGERGEVKQ